MSDMEIEVKKEILEPIVEIYKTVTDEILIECNATGLNVLAVDPAHVEIIKLQIPKSAFEVYNINSESIKIGIDINKLKNLLKLEPKGSIFSLYYDKDKDSQICRFVCKHKNLTHKIGLIDINNYTLPKLPVLDLKNRAIIFSKNMDNAVKSIKSISDQIQLVIKSNSIEVLNVCDSNQDRVKSELQYTEIVASERSITNFSYDYFKGLIDGIKKYTDTIEIFNSTNYPLQLSVNTDNLNVIAFLAPRFEEDNGEPEYSFEDFEPWNNNKLNRVRNITINGIDLEFGDRKINIKSYGDIEILRNDKPIGPAPNKPDNLEPEVILVPEPEIEIPAPDTIGPITEPEPIAEPEPIPQPITVPKPVPDLEPIPEPEPISDQVLVNNGSYPRNFFTEQAVYKCPKCNRIYDYTAFYGYGHTIHDCNNQDILFQDLINFIITPLPVPVNNGSYCPRNYFTELAIPVRGRTRTGQYY